MTSEDVQVAIYTGFAALIWVVIIYIAFKEGRQ